MPAGSITRGVVRGFSGESRVLVAILHRGDLAWTVRPINQLGEKSINTKKINIAGCRSTRGLGLSVGLGPDIGTSVAGLK